MTTHDNNEIFLFIFFSLFRLSPFARRWLQGYWHTIIIDIDTKSPNESTILLYFGPEPKWTSNTVRNDENISALAHTHTHTTQKNETFHCLNQFSYTFSLRKNSSFYFYFYYKYFISSDSHTTSTTFRLCLSMESWSRLRGAYTHTHTRVMEEKWTIKWRRECSLKSTQIQRELVRTKWKLPTSNSIKATKRNRKRTKHRKWQNIVSFKSRGKWEM